MGNLLTHQAVTHPNTVVGSPLDVTGFRNVRVELYHGFNAATANTNPGTFLVQASRRTTGTEDFVTILPFTVTSVTPSTVVFAQNEAAGDTVIEVASTTGFTTNGALLYVRDTVLANSEWVFQRRFVTNTSITLVDGLARAHNATTTAFFSGAERFVANIDVAGIERIRAVYLHEGTTGANVHIRGLLIGHRLTTTAKDLAVAT